LQERQRMAGKNVAVVLTGGNIERRRFLQVISGQTPATGHAAEPAAIMA
jgi:threonine dehydratase